MRCAGHLYCLIVLLLLGAAPGVTQAAPIDEANATLSELTERKLPRLNTKLGPAERLGLVRQILREEFDIEGLGQFVLGRYWRQASEVERKDYLAAFEDLIARTFASGLEDHPVGRISIQAVRALDDGSVAASSEIFFADHSDHPFRVDWRLRKSGSRYRIADLIIEGLSVSILLRDAFVQATQQGGGSVAELINRLKLLGQGG